LDSGLNPIISVDYSPSGPWPAAANGGGRSLEIIGPNGDAADPANWQASALFDGTPGLANSIPAPPSILLSELMAENVTAVANGGSYPDWVELYNPGTGGVNLQNWSLSNSGDPRRFVFPPNTVI